MKKKLYWIILLGCMITSLNAQTVKEAFITFPDPSLLALNTNARLDLIDLYQANQSAVIENDLGDSIFIRQMQNDYIHIQSGNSDTEIIILSMINESKVICVVQTISTPVQDSNLEFYTTNWKKLDSKAFINPVDKSWFLKESDDFPALDISLMKFHYNPEKQILSQTYTTPSYLSFEDQKRIEGHIKEENKEYKWNGIQFE